MYFIVVLLVSACALMCVIAFYDANKEITINLLNQITHSANAYTILLHHHMLINNKLIITDCKMMIMSELYTLNHTVKN